MTDNKVTTDVDSVLSLDETDASTLPPYESETKDPGGSPNGNSIRTAYVEAETQTSQTSAYTITDAHNVLQGIRQAVVDIHDTSVSTLTDLRRMDGSAISMSIHNARKAAKVAAKNYVAILSGFADMMDRICSHLRYYPGDDPSETYTNAVHVVATCLVDANREWYTFLYPPDPQTGRQSDVNKRLLYSYGDGQAELDRLFKIHREMAVTKALSNMWKPAARCPNSLSSGSEGIRRYLEKCLDPMNATNTPVLRMFSVRKTWIKHLRETFIQYIHACTCMGCPPSGGSPVHRLYLEHADEAVRDLEKSG